MHQQRPRRLQGLTRRPARCSQDQGRYPGRLRRTPPSHSVLPTVSDHCTPRFRGKRQLPCPHSCAPPLLVTIKGGSGLPLAAGSLSGFSLQRGRSGTTENSSQPTPLLAETWEPPSLSRLACIPYYKHSGCKTIQCPRTPLCWTYDSVDGTRINPCVTVLPLASSSGTRKHAAFTSWDPDPQVGTPTVGAPGKCRCV